MAMTLAEHYNKWQTQIDTFNTRDYADNTRQGACIPVDTFYGLPYPICWFRSMVHMMFLEPMFRDVILDGFKQEARVDVGIWEDVRALMYRLANYIDRKIYMPDISDNNLYYLGYQFKSDLHGYMTFEDLVIYFMHLLNRAKSSVQPKDTITTYFGRKNILRFFREAFYNFKGPIDYKIVSLTGNNKLVADVVNSETRATQIVPETEPDFLVVDYGNILQNLSKKQNKLALYVKYGEEHYCLRSLMVTDYKGLSGKVFSGHQFGVFACGSRYMTMESRLETGDGFYNFYSGDIELLESLLTRNGVIRMGMNDERHHFNLNKSIRVGIYFPAYLDFTPREVEFLQEMADRKCTAARYIALWAYFVNGAVVTVGDKTYTTGCTKTKTDHVITHTFFVAPKPVQPQTNVEIKAKVVVKYHNYTYTLEYPLENPTTWAAPRKTQEYTYNVPPFENVVDILEQQLKGVVAGALLITAVTQGEGWNAPRHSSHKSVFEVLAAASRKQEGGGAGKSTRVRYQGRTYKVRLEKATRRRYVVVRKKKVYLKDIRGRYRRAA